MPEPLSATPSEVEALFKPDASNHLSQETDTRNLDSDVYCSKHRRSRKQQLLLRSMSEDGARCPACHDSVRAQRGDIGSPDTTTEQSSFLKDVRVELNVSEDSKSSESEDGHRRNRDNLSWKNYLNQKCWIVIILFSIFLFICLIVTIIFGVSKWKDSKLSPDDGEEKGNSQNSSEIEIDPIPSRNINCSTSSFLLDKRRLQKDPESKSNGYILPWITEESKGDNQLMYNNRTRTFTVVNDGQYFISANIHMDTHSWIPIDQMDKTFNAFVCLHISDYEPICSKVILVSKLVIPIHISTQRYITQGRQLHFTVTVSDKNIICAANDLDRLEITPHLC